MSSLTISARPNKDDVKRIALAMADVLNIPTEKLSGLDASGVCAWLRENMPDLDKDRGITQKPALQRNLCQKLSLLVGKSSQQEEACGAVAGKMCELADSVVASFDVQCAALEQAIGSVRDADSKSRLLALQSKMGLMKSQLEKQREVVNSFARSAEGQEAKTAAAWATKMTAALSSVPTIAEMIVLVCDSSDECEAACAASAEVSGGDCGCDGPKMEFTGGWIHGGTSGGLTIDSRVKKVTDARKLALKEFRVKAESLFDQLLRAVYSLGQRLGKGAVPMNDDLHRFVNAFEQLDNVYTPGIEYALTGFYTHATAVEQRERFLGKLQALITVLNPLVSGPNGDVFREIKTPLEELQKHSDKYSDQFRASNPGVIQTRYGNPTSGGVDFKGMAASAREALDPANIRKATDQAIETKHALQEAAVKLSRSGGGDTPSKAGLTLRNVTKSLTHFFSVAKMRENLKKVSSESKGYNANYDEVLGKPFAHLIDKERKKFEKFKEELEGPVSQSYVYGGSKIPLAAAYGTIKKAVEYGSQGGDEIAREWNKEAITQAQLNSCNARIELYNVIQAIDLALMNFTDSITANPDDVKEISKLLNSTEIVAEWFNEASGDHVAGLFEYMPSIIEAKVDGSDLKTKLSLLGKNDSSVGGGTTAIIDDKGTRLKKIDGHYYNEVAKIEALGQHPGNPFLMISPARAEYAREFAKKTVERMLSLKNIVSAFAFMGSRARSGGPSGGADSWEPARIYAALCKYLYTSAFAMGWDGYDATVTGDSAKFQRFGKPYADASGAPVKVPNTVHGYTPELSSINLHGIITGVLPFDSSVKWHQLLKPATGSKLSDYGAKKQSKAEFVKDTRMLMYEDKLNKASADVDFAPLLVKINQALSAYDAANGLLPFPDIKKFNAGKLGEVADDVFNKMIASLDGFEFTTDPFKDLSADFQGNLLESDRKDTHRTALVEYMDAVKTELLGQIQRQIITSASGGALSGFDSTNWIDYCNAMDQTTAPGAHGWIIAFNPGDDAKKMEIVPPFARCAFGCAMNSISLGKDASGPFKTVGGWSGQFRDTDDLFMRAIKAMTAKVMTVAGLYNKLHFSSADDHTLSASRFIIGGSSSAGGLDTPANSLAMVNVPQIYDDAVELYIRLPLLVEFYRDIYSLTGKKLGPASSSSKENDSLIVALVPEMDLTWSSLMRLSFDAIGNGQVVTKSYAAQMINEINMIYDKYKSRGSASMVSAVVNDFIADVNTRFGIMTKLESIKYIEMMQATRRSYEGFRANDEDVLVNFDTLGDNDFADRKAAALPSDKFTKSAAGTTSADQAKEFNMGFIKALAEFRDHIDQKIRKVTMPDPSGMYPMAKARKDIASDFHEQARIVKNELKLLTTPEQRFNAIYTAMSGLDNVMKIDNNSHVMFHEMVIAPLAIITAAAKEIGAFMLTVDEQWPVVSSAASTGDDVRLNISFVNLTRAIMAHVSGQAGLVDMNVSGSKLIVDHSKLQGFVEGLLGFVNKNIQKFRTTVDLKTIETYEIKIREIQSGLIENVFRSEGDVTKGLEAVSRRLTRMYGIFALGRDSYGEGESDQIAIAPITKKISYCSAMRQLAYYDPYAISEDFKDVKPVLTRDSRLEKLFMRKIDGKDVYMYEDLMFASRREIYESKNVFMTDIKRSGSMGLMMRFNELMARYLEQFWDESNRKIYLPMIAAIAGNSDAAVNKAQGWPDLMLPKGNSNIPGISGSDWAKRVSVEFGDLDGKTTPIWNVSFNNLPQMAGMELKVACQNFLTDLGNTSSSIAPSQLVNILKHAFDRATILPGADLDLLNTYRNRIIQAIGENWSKYGPIAAIAASTLILSGLTPGNGPIETLDNALSNAEYKAPGVIPDPLSEFSGVRDILADDKAFGNPDEIMFASVAKVIRTMLTAQDKGVPLYSLPSLADSAAGTPRMKENIRANLPIFTKMFGMLNESCNILSKIMSMNINVDDTTVAGATRGERVAQNGVQGRVFAAGYVGEKPFKGDVAHSYFSHILGKIMSSCNTMVNTAAAVMGEVSDNPLYLETGENSISAYRNITNVPPFMPLSTIFAGLRDHTNADAGASSDTLLPLHDPGARAFELNYGTRFILGQPKMAALMDHTPGVREIVENYNKMVQSDCQITLENISRMQGEYVQLMRWVVDINAYVPILVSLPGRKTGIPRDATWQYRSEGSLDSALDLTTNIDKPRMVATLAQWVGKSKAGHRDKVLDREMVQVMNLLDLNVNPVNINALRREVPLVNMLNYAFTYDSFVKDILGLDVYDNANPGDVRQMYLALAIDPYRQKMSTEWEKIFGCYSDTSADLGFGGHSRFGQDQIFRKALLYHGKYPLTKDREHTGLTIASAYRYPGKGTPGRNRDNLNNVAMPLEQSQYLDILGQMRHDTTFIRNLLMIDTAHRLLRVRLSNEMTRITFPVVTGAPSVSKHITDENVWETYDDVRNEYD